MEPCYPGLCVQDSGSAEGIFHVSSQRKNTILGMISNTFHIRLIKPEDNPKIGSIIRAVLPGTGAPLEGTAFQDPALDAMFETYSAPRSRYWVVAGNDTIWGGGGIARLDGGNEDTCELQKMYFLEGLRGRGFGQKLLSLALATAKDLGYRQCYLETMPFMEAALSLYKRNGFVHLDKPMGCTGHTACQVWMIKDLS